MKPITRIFLIFQLLDIVISAIAIYSGIAWEGNPIGFSIDAIIVKLLVINIVFSVLEKESFSKAIWIIPIISGLVVAWNIFVVGIELMV